MNYQLAQLWIGSPRNWILLVEHGYSYMRSAVRTVLLFTDNNFCRNRALQAPRMHITNLLVVLSGLTTITLAQGKLYLYSKLTLF